MTETHEMQAKSRLQSLACAGPDAAGGGRSPVAGPATALEFQATRRRFLESYLAWLRDPAVPIEVKSHEAQATARAVRELALLHGVVT